MVHTGEGGSTTVLHLTRSVPKIKETEFIVTEQLAGGLIASLWGGKHLWAGCSPHSPHSPGHQLEGNCKVVLKFYQEMRAGQPAQITSLLTSLQGCTLHTTTATNHVAGVTNCWPHRINISFNCSLMLVVNYKFQHMSNSDISSYDDNCTRPGLQGFINILEH